MKQVEFRKSQVDVECRMCNRQIDKEEKRMVLMHIPTVVFHICSSCAYDLRCAMESAEYYGDI